MHAVMLDFSGCCAAVLQVCCCVSRYVECMHCARAFGALDMALTCWLLNGRELMIEQCILQLWASVVEIAGLLSSWLYVMKRNGEPYLADVLQEQVVHLTVLNLSTLPNASL